MTGIGQEPPLGDGATTGKGGPDTDGAPGPGGGLRLLEALFSLRGRVALVTGGSTGIGRGIAEALAGASVVLVARGNRPWTPPSLR